MVQYPHSDGQVIPRSFQPILVACPDPSTAGTPSSSPCPAASALNGSGPPPSPARSASRLPVAATWLTPNQNSPTRAPRSPPGSPNLARPHQETRGTPCLERLDPGSRDRGVGPRGNRAPRPLVLAVHLVPDFQ